MFTKVSISQGNVHETLSQQTFAQTLQLRRKGGFGATELAQFLATLAFCSRTILKNTLGRTHPFIYIILLQFILFFKSSQAKQPARQGVEYILGLPISSDDLCLCFCFHPSSRAVTQDRTPGDTGHDSEEDRLRILHHAHHLLGQGQLQVITCKVIN